jgi:FkbM family methyltransferase
MTRFSLARAFCGIIRFGELRVADRVFRNCPSPQLTCCSLFGSRFIGDVSRSSFQQLLYLQGERTIPERFLVKSLLAPGMHVVDVGANIGYYVSMYEQIIGAKGNITCIEPSPENLKELYENIAANQWPNVTVHECAVGNHTGTVGLRDGVNSGVVAVEEGVFQSSVRPLDEIVPSRCDFLKIDVDGYEWHVLQGAKRVIERDRPVLFLEYHPQLIGRHGGSIEEVMAFLRSQYSDITFFDSPDYQSIVSKITNRYFGASAVREIEIDGIPEKDLHVGRLYGTFWIVCRPDISK